MKFSEIVNQAIALLQDSERITYRALKREFDLDDEALEDLKEELVVARRIAADEDGKVLVWTGAGASAPAVAPPAPPSSTGRDGAEAERRQLTVMFCDLVGSTPLSEQLDPEDYREVIQAYQQACGAVIQRWDGYIACYVGDGLLIYFGYPTAQEDAAARAVRAGLGILDTLPALNTHFQSRLAVLNERPLQVRIGIHTGEVVVGEMGDSSYRVEVAVGQVPNVAARIQGLARPNEVLISSATYPLVQGLFACQTQGPQELKGVSTPLEVYHVLHESEAQSRFDVAVRTGLTPLVGREGEVQFLEQRWAQAQTGNGQAVLVSGEAGIGKSRLVQELRERVDKAGGIRIEYRCSPYHQNSALYPVIAHVERVLGFASDDTPASKLEKLQRTLSAYRFPQADTVALLATLLSLPHPEGYPPLTVSAQKQKAQTQRALVDWLFEETEKTQVCCTWEDLHWADPSTLEFLSLCLDQIPTARMLALLVFRPEFIPSWGARSYLSQLTLSRLGRPQVEGIVERVTKGRAFPSAVVAEVVAKTDGVPLFVEELTKMIVESGLLRAVNSHYELTGPLSSLAIPATLHDSLMARLDRLGTAKEVAQLGAVIGREFRYELLQAVSSADEETLQTGLAQLVAAELVNQRGQVPEARYLFKHALIQDTAYQSLLKSKRREYHQQIAHVLEERFAETVVTQPELVAHHYTEAGLNAQAIPHWQKAAERATQRSANVEAIAHLTQGLQVLKRLPDTVERAQQELGFQIALGAPLMAAKGYAAPERETVFARARELCQQIGETPQLFPVLAGLRSFYTVRGKLQTARELGEQLLRLAQNVRDVDLLQEAHWQLGVPLTLTGEFALARAHFEQTYALYDPQQHSAHAYQYGLDPGVGCRSFLACTFWFLGYPDQALKWLHEARTLAEELSHPHSLVLALLFAPIHWLRREADTNQEWNEEGLALARKHEFPLWLAAGECYRGWLRVDQGEGEAGLAQIQQALANWQTIGSRAYRTHFLLYLAESCGKVGQVEEGLNALAEALVLADKTEERWYEAELYRLKGELMLQESKVESHRSQVQEEAEECFQKALGVARQQEAKSWELRAATSLARLWQQQGKRAEAHELLVPVYDWFTEGFDTADLKDAKALIAELP